MKFLTFDLGTTLYKVALFDEQGRMVGIERVEPEIEHPEPGRWEIHRVLVLDQLAKAALRLQERARENWADIAAISFATQANSFLLKGDQGTTPFVLWPDQRAQSLKEQLERVSQIPGFQQTTGMPRFGPLLGLAKALTLSQREWVKEFRYLSDDLTAAMANQLCTEAGVAGLSGACDVKSLIWWPAVFRTLNLPIQWMPNIVRAGTDLGTVRPEFVELLGVSPDCRFVVGCLDQYAGAIGTGVVDEGMVCETTGTVLAAVRFSKEFDENPGEGVFQGPSFERGCFYQMSFSSTSANLLEHYRNSLSDKPSFEELTREAMDAPECDLQIIPYDDRGGIEKCFANVRPGHTRGQIVRAIMRRVAESLKDQVLKLSHGQIPKEIRSAGGAAKNDCWLQLKASILGARFCAMEAEEPTSLGAAILAASACGLGDVRSLSRKWARIRKTFNP